MTDKQKSREQQMVVIERDEKGVPAIWCDPEVVTIVAALNSGGVRTVASCSGHGVRPGAVALADGRELIIAKDYAEARTIEGHFPGINGEQPRLEASRAADKARIAELYELLREARDIVEERRVAGENDDSLIYAIDAALAHQTKEH